MSYELTETEYVIDLQSGLLIKDGPGYEAQWAAYQAWLSQGNQPEPALSPTEEQARRWADLRAERDHRLSETDWLVLRHQEQVAAGLGTSLTGAVYQSLLEYRQALRDLPEQTVDPVASDWPVSPV